MSYINKKSEVVKMNKKVRTIEQIANSYYRKYARKNAPNVEEFSRLGNYAALFSKRDAVDNKTIKRIALVIINKDYTNAECEAFWSAYKKHWGKKYEEVIIKLYNYLIENGEDYEFYIDCIMDNYLELVKDGSPYLSLGEEIDMAIGTGYEQLLEEIVDEDMIRDELKELLTEEEIRLCKDLHYFFFSSFYAEYIFRENNMYRDVINKL